MENGSIFLTFALSLIVDPCAEDSPIMVMMIVVINRKLVDVETFQKVITG